MPILLMRGLSQIVRTIRAAVCGPELLPLGTYYLNLQGDHGWLNIPTNHDIARAGRLVNGQ